MIKRFSIYALFVLLGLNSSALTQSTSHWEPLQRSWLEQQKKMYLMSPAEVDGFLRQLHDCFPRFEDRLRALSLVRLDTPYDWKAIGDGKGYEPNPVFTVSKTNCTVQILTNAALSHGLAYAEAESLMAFINYYPVDAGQNPVRYENRRHYTSDRILTSPYFEEFTSRVGKPNELDSIQLVLNRKQDGTHFLPVDWEKEVMLPYMPTAKITAEFLERLPEVCGVGIIRKKLFKLGVIIAHEGMIFDGKTFVHASSRAKKVVAEDFLAYCSSNKGMHGAVFYLFKKVN